MAYQAPIRIGENGFYRTGAEIQTKQHSVSIALEIQRSHPEMQRGRESTIPASLTF